MTIGVLVFTKYKSDPRNMEVTEGLVSASSSWYRDIDMCAVDSEKSAIDDSKRSLDRNSHVARHSSSYCLCSLRDGWPQ